MHVRLLQDLAIENNNKIEIIPEGTIISEATIDLDNEVDSEVVKQEDMMKVVQQWASKYKPMFGKDWSKVIDFLQPAIDAIHDGDIKSLKSRTINLAKKSERLSHTNPKAKDAIDRIHDLYIKLLGMAREVFGECIDEVVNIITECKRKLS